MTGYACIYFVAMHLVLHMIFTYFNPLYTKLAGSKQIEYRTNYVSPIHSIVCQVFSVVGMFFLCGGHETVFNSTECIETPRYWHIWAIIHTCCYFIVDFFFLMFGVGGTTNFDKQMYAHHVISAVTAYSTLVFMNFTVVFAVMLLFTEVSSVYVCMRWILYTHKMD